MDRALLGFLVVFGTVHLLLVIVPVRDTLKARISMASKLAGCAFLLCVPFIGTAIFHYRFRSGLLQAKGWEPSAHDLGARNPDLPGRHKKDDNHCPAGSPTC